MKYFNSFRNQILFDHSRVRFLTIGDPVERSWSESTRSLSGSIRTFWNGREREKNFKAFFGCCKNATWKNVGCHVAQLEERASEGNWSSFQLIDGTRRTDRIQTDRKLRCQCLDWTDNIENLAPKAVLFYFTYFFVRGSQLKVKHLMHSNVWYS